MTTWPMATKPEVGVVEEESCDDELLEDGDDFGAERKDGGPDDTADGEVAERGGFCWGGGGSSGGALRGCRRGGFCRIRSWDLRGELP